MCENCVSIFGVRPDVCLRHGLREGRLVVYGLALGARHERLQHLWAMEAGRWRRQRMCNPG